MFIKGQSGNPSGRPKENNAAKKLAQSHCKTAIKKLAELMDSKDERIVVAACQALLDRGLGKPAQAVDVSGGLELRGQLLIKG